MALKGFTFDLIENNAKIFIILDLPSQILISGKILVYELWSTSFMVGSLKVQFFSEGRYEAYFWDQIRIFCIKFISTFQTGVVKHVQPCLKSFKMMNQ